MEPGDQMVMWFEVSYKTITAFEDSRSWFLTFLANAEKRNPIKSNHLREHVRFDKHELSCFFDGNCGQGVNAVPLDEVDNLHRRLMMRTA